MTGHSIISDLRYSRRAGDLPKRKPEMINVIIADHEAIFRAGAARVLAVEDDLRIVAVPESWEKLLNALDRLRAHVLLVSQQFLPALLEDNRLRDQHGTAVVVLAEEDDTAATLVAMGAHGVVYRSIEGPSLVQAVRRVTRGEMFIHCPNSIIKELHEDTTGAHVVDRLSEMELCMIAAVFRSCTNREIAEQFGTTENAVKNALRGVFDKIGVSDRLELALFVFHHRMLQHATQAARIADGLTVQVDEWPRADATRRHLSVVSRNRIVTREPQRTAARLGTVKAMQDVL
jgi:DNA-binding NarL/FixJ family response regulator